MSFYNMLMGMNLGYLVAVSLVTGENIRNKFPRFRNIWASELDGVDYEVYTRVGGGNASCWADEDEDYGNPCECPACIAAMIENSGKCVDASDDDFDCTYKTFYMVLTDSQRHDLNQYVARGIPESKLSQVYKLFPELAPKVVWAKDVHK